MTLRHFKIFITVCDTMNMTTAGEKLFLSQSAVSQAISELEKYYLSKLFERLSRKLYLTHSGEKLLSYARHIVRMNEETVYEMKMLKDGGFIRIGASVTVCTCILPKAVTELQRLRTNAKIEVYENNTGKIENMILQDQIDIGIVEGNIHSSDIISIPFMEDDLVLVCGKKHRFHKLNKILPIDLEKENFIIRELGSGTRETFEDVMTANQIIWNASWTCNNADSIINAVEEGLGVTVISNRLVQNEIACGDLIKLQIEGIEFKRDFKICYHKHKYLSDLINQFMVLIKNQKYE